MGGGGADAVQTRLLRDDKRAPASTTAATHHRPQLSTEHHRPLPVPERQGVLGNQGLILAGGR